MSTGIIVPARFGDYELTQRQLDNFWAKVDKSGGPDACWLWTRQANRDGHGTMRLWMSQHKTYTGVYVHRLAWVILEGPIPPGLQYRHRCPGGPNPACVNPAHALLGTTWDNNQDKVEMGRVLAKLSDEQVLEIRERYGQGGVTQGALADEYGVGLSTIGNIVSGHSRRLRRAANTRRTPVTPEEVVEIREKYSLGGVTYEQLAREFNLGMATISNIVRRRSWKHVEARCSD